MFLTFVAVSCSCLDEGNMPLGCWWDAYVTTAHSQVVYRPSLSDLPKSVHGVRVHAWMHA